jgi:Holliday junction resolvase RusA-like endonuclease
VSIVIWIPGPPVPTGRGRTVIAGGRAHVFTPARTRDYANLVKLAATEAMKGRPPLATAVQVRIEVRLPIPASMSSRNRVSALRGILLPAKRPDLDNCIKAATDGLKGIVLVDDAMICRLAASKCYSTVPGVRVEVEPC